MNTADQFKNPDKLVALSESLLKQGIAKTKLDADRMAEGMIGETKNVRPNGQRFHFGLNDKKSEARIDNYSGPATLGYDEKPVSFEKPQVSVIERENQHHDAFKALSIQIESAQSQIEAQQNVIDNLQSEIQHLKTTHEVFHSKMEELHHKIGEQIPNQKPLVQDKAVNQLDTMMQQPVDMDAENRREEADLNLDKEIYREVEETETKSSADDEYIRRAQERNPVPKHEVVDIDLGNIFNK